MQVAVEAEGYARKRSKPKPYRDLDNVHRYFGFILMKACRLHSATQVKTHLYFSRTGETITNNFSQEQFNSIEVELIRIVTAIVADGKVKSLTALSKNRSHCPECQYSPDKITTCVVDPVIKLETISMV